MGFKLPKIGKNLIGAAVLGGPTGASIAGTAALLQRPGQTGIGAGGAPIFGMKKTEDFIKEDPAEQIQRAKLNADGGALGRRFNSMRERASQENNAALGSNIDALKRRFAAMGSTGSGAMIKLQQQATEQADKMRSQSMQDINMAEEDANMQRDAMQAQMDQQVNLAQADMNFKNRVFSFERGSKLHELDLAERQQQIDSSTTDFNKRLSEQMSRPKQGLISGMLGDIL